VVVSAGLRLSDTAVYTCKAVSETGETSWSAALSVRAPSNPSIVFHRTPEPSTFPGAPSKPVVSEIAATSVRLTWHPNSNTGASQTHSYTVEYFSHDTGDVRQSCVRTLRPYRAIELCIIRPHHSTTYVDAICCYRRSSVVCRSVCVSQW